MGLIYTNQEAYDLWSDSYDCSPNPTVMIDELRFPAQYKNWRNHNILEIGCGTGRHTVRLFEQKNSITGIDLSNGMLSKAREKLPEVKFIHGDFMEYDFQKESFDKIILSLVLEHIDDLNLFFLRLSKILKRRGEILISELHPIRSKKGSFARFKNIKGEEIFLKSIAHSENNILEAAKKRGFKLNYKKDIFGDSELVGINEKWIKYLDNPMIQFWSFYNKK